MFKRFLIFLTATLVALSSSSHAEDTPAQMDDARAKMAGASTTKVNSAGTKRIDSSVTELSTTVQAVDLQERTITVVAADGQPVTFAVHPEVQRLSEVKPGDKIALRYYQSLALELRAPTATERKHPHVVGDGVGINNRDLPPGLAAAKTVHAIVTVVGINRDKNTVTVKGPAGRVVEVRARDPKNLDRLKLNDTIAATYTEGLAVGIVPQP